MTQKQQQQLLLLLLPLLCPLPENVDFFRW